MSDSVRQLALSSTGLVENSQEYVRFYVYRTDGKFHFSPGDIIKPSQL